MDYFLLLLGLLVGWLVNWASDALPRRLGRATAVKRDDAWWVVAGMSVAVAGGTAVLFLYFGRQEQWLALPTVAFFLLIALIDARYRLVFNVLVYPAIGLVLLYQLSAGTHAFLAVLLGGGLAFGAFALVAWLRPGSLGGGDVKLAALIGLLFGFPGVLWPLLMGVGAGGLAAGYWLWRGNGRAHHIPYAPFLCLGVILALIYGG